MQRAARSAQKRLAGHHDPTMMMMRRRVVKSDDALPSRHVAAAQGCAIFLLAPSSPHPPLPDLSPSHVAPRCF